VAVRSGRVAVIDTTVHQGAPQLVAMANDVARVDSSGMTLLRGEQNVASLLQWADGRLVYKNARVGTVLPELARWYNVTFRVTDPKINTLLLTAAFDNRSIEDLPHVLSIVLNVDATRSGRTITLAPW
jgi:transmembrane sensor